MKVQAMCALGAALAFAPLARAQQAGEAQPELAPLVPPKAPWLKKDEKPAAPAKKKPVAKRKKKQAPQAAEVKPAAPLPPLALPEPAAPAPPKPVEAELPLPPLVPPTPAPVAVSNLAVVLQAEGLDAAASARVEEGLRGVAAIAPRKRSASLARPARPCADDACFMALGAAEKIDQLLVASYAQGALELRVLDVEARKRISSARETGVGASPAEAAAWAEALACRLLVPAGCTGTASVDAAEGVQLELDGQPLAPGEKRAVPVGMHELKARSGARVAQRMLPVLREGAPALYARVVDGQPRFVSPSEAVAVAAPAAAVSVAPAPARSPQRKWTRPVGYAALGAGAIAAGLGAYFGAKSRSDLNSAESAFRTNGGAYRAGDAQTLSSGNSAAKNANALFIASGVLLAAGAVFTLAF